MGGSSGLEKALEKGSLHEIIKAVHQSESGAECVEGVRVHVLNNHTVDNLEWFLRAQGYAQNLKVAYTQGPYDGMMQEILDPQSTLYQSRPDIAVLSMLFEGLVPDFARNQFSAAAVIERLQQMFEGLTSRSNAVVIANTFLLPLSTAEGVASCRHPHSIENKIRVINEWWRELAVKTPNLFLIDLNRIEQRLGAPQSRDYRLWFTARGLLTSRFLQIYAQEILQITLALRGKSKKCLVIDCDNTLWGGTIGEDGLDGIHLDAHRYPGNIFYRAQENILALVDRGVILCLCSKNDPEDVWEVLDTHPHCLIKREHLAGWRINWESKAANLESLAHEIGLGTDSFVFVDDEPAECQLVRMNHPEVRVLQVPRNLFLYPQLFFESGGFDALFVGPEDRQRGKMYQAEAARKKENERYGCLDDFLASLEMIATIRTVRPGEIQRVAQLTQKTNQFNLTTRRYSEGEMLSLAANADVRIFSLSVTDKFGGMGLTGVLIAKREGRSAHIDTFLLSCRVLGRKLEHTFLDVCMSQLEETWQCASWTSEYVPTRKNGLAAGFWPELGFMETKRDQDGSFYSLQVDRRKPFAAPFIQVVREL
jgi:FkbH-like protein